MRRRTFLSALVAMAAAFASGGFILSRLRVDLDVKASLGVIGDEDQMATLLSLAEAMLPMNVIFDESGVRRAIDVQTQRMPGLLPEYQRAVLLLDESASQFGGMGFKELSIERRQQVIRAVMPMFSMDDSVGRVLNRVTVAPRRRAFAAFVVRRVNQAIYSTPVGWQVVGYKHYIGMPAEDPLEYTRAVSVP